MQTPKEAVAFDESPEGHALRFDREGRLIGVTIVNAKLILQEEGAITITIPERVQVGPDALADALAAPA